MAMMNVALRSLQRTTMRLVPAMVAGFALVMLSPASAWACTPRPYDHNRAVYVAEGRVERVVEQPGRTRPGGGFVTVAVVVRPDAAHKGQVPDPLVFFDSASYEPATASRGSRWSGNSGACGTFTSNPVGRYMLLAVGGPADDLHPIITAVAIGDGPDDPSIVRLRQFIQTQPATAIPPSIVPAVPTFLADGNEVGGRTPPQDASASTVRDSQSRWFTLLVTVGLVGAIALAAGWMMRRV